MTMSSSHAIRFLRERISLYINLLVWIPNIEWNSSLDETLIVVSVIYLALGVCSLTCTTSWKSSITLGAISQHIELIK